MLIKALQNFHDKSKPQGATNQYLAGNKYNLEDTFAKRVLEAKDKDGKPYAEVAEQQEQQEGEKKPLEKPTKDSTVKDMKAYLEAKGVKFIASANKTELLELVEED
jgi:hypothetical protein